MDTRFDPPAIESRWYKSWEDAGVFTAEADDRRTPYTIVIPPPNVTGALHMGHALNNVIQDVYIRLARMKGLNALWVPGTDHAGIATQNVVEKDLAKEGKRKEDLGREAFVSRVWEWKRKFGHRIVDQLKSLGCSCDWSRERFTLDDGLYRAVMEVFVRLFEKGLVYRDEALVNWCPRCLTTLSNEECPAEEEGGSFFDLRYPVVGEEDRHVTVSTTRPETMLGDTAVAVHPDDERYTDLIGKTVLLPLTNREIPVVADAHADPEKGSGAVKITPAHDFDDFLVGKRHDLPRVCVIGEDGKMTDEAGEYAGLDRLDARKRIVADLTGLGLLGRVEDRRIPLPKCYRCNTVVEPHLSRQWFVKMRPLLEPAADAVKDGRVKFVPARYSKLYLEWVEKYIDWPISRQLWWGHRIPVYYCDGCEETVVAREKPDACPACGGGDLTQDEDVLDTWFSSQLWPFSVLGWPEETPELSYFYPTALMVTARDIIYFWVARMVMAGLEFRGEVPFPTVYIHGTILDDLGRRMSKSLNNGIDPVEMVSKFGADAVRFSLMLLVSEGQDIKLSESRFEMGRNFANKLWNASRFAIMNLISDEGVPEDVPDVDLAFEDRWILSRLNQTVKATTETLDRYRMADAANALYSFVWREFCDWYLEIVKPRLYDREETGTAVKSRAAARHTLAKTLKTALRLLHPMIPFVTEEIHDHVRQALGRSGHFVSLADWPVADGDYINETIDREMETMIAITRAIRNIRAEMNVPEGARLEVRVAVTDEAGKDLVTRHGARICNMAKLNSIDAGVGLAKPPTAAVAVVGDMTIFVPLGDVIDLDAERARLGKEAEKVEKMVRTSERKLANRDFLSRAPEEVVERERLRRDELATRHEAIQAQLKSLKVGDFGG